MHSPAVHASHYHTVKLLTLELKSNQQANLAHIPVNKG
jgi:hypothetical protein